MGVTIPASSWLQGAHPHGEVPNESPQFIAGHVESTLYCVLFPTVLVTVVLLCFSRFRQKQHSGLHRFGESRQLMQPFPEKFELKTLCRKFFRQSTPWYGVLVASFSLLIVENIYEVKRSVHTKIRQGLYYLVTLKRQLELQGANFLFFF